MIKRLFLGMLILFFMETAMATEEPNYTIIEQSGDFELRTYSPMIVAETTVSGSLDDATSAGFKTIAGYIFGNNTSAAGGGEKVSMTAPVTVVPTKNEMQQSEKISMTVPVSMEHTEGQWRMHFVMPEEYTMDSLPTPNDSAVTLREIAERKYAVIRFSGFTGEAKIAKKTAKLIEWLAEKGINPIGEPELARYNPPWSLPFLRRNEIMVHISQ
jgi:hypothetical protein